MATKYLIVHTTHNGCYDCNINEQIGGHPIMSKVKINTPKVFMFESKFQAYEFFNEYVSDIDCVDHRCMLLNGDVDHLDLCTCGIVEMDNDGCPNIFYNKNHQIFLLELGAQTFVPSSNMRIDINNINLTNKHILKCKKLSREQRDAYIELGRVCQQCKDGTLEDYDDDDEDDDYKPPPPSPPDEPSSSPEENTVLLNDSATKSNDKKPKEKKPKEPKEPKEKKPKEPKEKKPKEPKEKKVKNDTSVDN
jgi:hypothetical protein